MFNFKSYFFFNSIKRLVPLFRHGLFGFRTNWRSLAKAFSERAKIKVKKRIQSFFHSSSIQVVTVDMRNHGDSPFTTSMTYPDMSSDLIQTIQKHKTPKTILMGHSMGGKAAMLVALQEVRIDPKMFFCLFFLLDLADTFTKINRS